MKKHNEGYVMVYVTVVLLLFCLIATMLLSGAMKNLQTQQDAIAQMQDRYAAEGLIEQVMATGDRSNLPDGVKWNSETGTLTATYGTATVVCVINEYGKILSYDISYGIGGDADATDESTPEGA